MKPAQKGTLKAYSHDLKTVNMTVKQNNKTSKPSVYKAFSQSLMIEWE